MYRTATFTGKTSTENEAIMTAIKSTAGISDTEPMCFKSLHLETTADTTVIFNNNIAMKLKPSLLVDDSYFIDIDSSVALVGFITIVDTGIEWEISGSY